MDRNVYWGKSGIDSASGEKGARNLLDIVGDPTFVKYIFGWGSDHLGSITAPEQELRQQEEIIDPGSMPVGYTDVCWRSLVVARVGSGYLVGIDFR